MAVRHRRPASLAAQAASAQPRHLRGCRSLINEDQRLGVEIELAVEPGYAAAQDIGTLLFLPPYSPDFNPIEMAFSKLKALLRKAAARTVDDLWTVVADSLVAFTPADCRHYFEAAGYDPE